MKRVYSKKILYILFLIIGFAFLYFDSRDTFTSYESEVLGNVEGKVSQIHLTVNGVELSHEDDLQKVLLDNLSWTSPHARDDTIAPGGEGSFPLELDPAGSEVAILFELEFIDKTIDSSKLLTFIDVSGDEGIVRTESNVYSGIISLDDISNHKVYHFNVSFLFDGTEDIDPQIDDNEWDYEDFFEIKVHVVQYQGEVLQPYTE